MYCRPQQLKRAFSHSTLFLTGNSPDCENWLNKHASSTDLEQHTQEVVLECRCATTGVHVQLTAMLHAATCDPCEQTDDSAPVPIEACSKLKNNNDTN